MLTPVQPVHPMHLLIRCAALSLLTLMSAPGADVRRNPPLTLDGYHPFHPVSSAQEWSQRRAEIRLRVQVAAGLWPLPEKSPLQPAIHGTVDCGDYTVSRVMFSSLPGHFVTGSLFQPAGPSAQMGLIAGKRPAVLCPHGHWKDGRFYDAGEKQAASELASGAERFLSAARNPLQARCVQLARMGCVAFLYDMLGYADSIQFPEHRNGPRAHLNSLTPGEWGFVSPAATARLQTNFGLQTWNSLRALDFLLSLPEIDPGRVLVTGASGGGTQTMMLAALDDRVSAAFPCVMVSTAMQGGCTCENSHFLRIGQGNVDIAAAFAPKPLGLTAADDWTVELETKGHPDLRALYQMLGTPSHYEAHFNIQFKHNYNHVSRTQMYQFANRHLRLNLPSPVEERDFRRLEKPELTVWTAAFPAPSGHQVGESHEKAVCHWWTGDASRQIDRKLLQPVAASLAETGAILRPALRVLIGRDLPSAADLSFELKNKARNGSLVSMTGTIRNTRHGEEVPALFLFPESAKDHVVLWLTAPGRSPQPQEPAIQQLLSQGCAVLFPELFGPDLPSNPATPYSGDTTRPENQWKLSPVYHYGYNPSLYARRVHDILTATAFVKTNPEWKSARLSLVALQGTSHLACAALALSGSAVERAVLEPDGFRFAKFQDAWHADFLPGAAKYGDILGMISLGAPQPRWITGTDEELKRQAQALYQALGASANLQTGEISPGALVSYLLPHSP